MAKAKNNGILIKLQSTASSHFRTTTKNKANKEKIQLKKYDPTPSVRKHVLYKEEKIK